MTGRTLVIGALGNVGAEVCKQLLARQKEVRAADLSVEAVQARFGDSVQPVHFDFSKKETYPNTFAGVEIMFLMRPPQISDVKGVMYPALDAAQQAGVKHVAFLSLIGIEKAKFVPHYKVEEYLLRSQMTWSFLRCSFFMQNLNTTHREEIRDRSEIFVPVGRARTSFIDVRDIAAAAVVALTREEHTNKAYNLTGAQALDYWQVAKTLSDVLGRPIIYRNPSAVRFLFTHLRRGMPWTFALVMTGLYLSTRSGMAEPVTDDLPRLIGRNPISFLQYAQEYAQMWT